MLFLVVVAAVEIISYVGLAFVTAPFGRTVGFFEVQSARIERLLSRTDKAIFVFDSTLGWRPRQNASGPTDHINAQGVRAHGEYSARPPHGRLRVAAFGDSFVYCTEVSDPDSWPFLVESGFPQLEMINYGVPAYGPDQAYMRFLHEGDALSPRAYLLGVSTASLDRVVSVYRRFLTPRGVFGTKPRFLLRPDGNLDLVPNPLNDLSQVRALLEDPRSITKLCKHDYWYEPLVFENPLYDYSASVRLSTSLWVKVNKRHIDPDRTLKGPSSLGVFNDSSTAFRILTRMVQEMMTRAQERQAQFIVLVLPDKYSLPRSLRGEAGVCDPFVDYCRREGIPHLDASTAFLAAPVTDVDAWFEQGGHYSPQGNRVVAEWLGRELIARWVDVPPK